MSLNDPVLRSSAATHRDLTRAAFLKVTAGAALCLPWARIAAGAVPPHAALPLVARTIPKSKQAEQLPVIGLGTAQEFGAHSDAANMKAKADVLKTLVADGGKVLDTAASYEDAEAVCGAFMAQMDLRPKIFIATKFGERGKENGIQAIENSFKRLKTDVIDLVYVHNMEDVDTHLPTLKDYKQRGKIRYIGVSSTGPAQGRLTGWMDDLDFVEFAYSVDYRKPEEKLLPMAKDKGVAVFAALPFGRNRLLVEMKGKDVPAWAKEELGCTSFAQLALKFIVSHPAVTTAIPGTENPQHMAENLAAGRLPLADEKQREKIAALWAKA